MGSQLQEKKTGLAALVGHFHLCLHFRQDADWLNGSKQFKPAASLDGGWCKG